MRQKILYLMEYPIDLPGGAQLSTIAVCEGVEKSGRYEAVVVCPKLLNPEKNNFSFKIREYPMGESRVKNLFIRIKAFKEIIREEEPDLIHIEMSESLITYGFIRRSFRNIRYIYTDRGMYFGYRLRSRIFMAGVLKDAALMLTTTDRNRRLWEEKSSLRSIETIHNTIGGAFTIYDSSKRRKNKKLTLGFAGRICPEKDWDLVSVLLEEIVKQVPELTVDLVISKFEKGDDEKALALKTSIEKVIGEENLIYREELSQEEMSDYYYGVDIFILTSCFESFGKTAVEAMSRGCAVLGTRVGGLPEVIGDERFIYTKEDLKKCADEVRRLSEDPEELRHTGEYFLKRYRENFTPEMYIARHLSVYDRLTS